MSKVTRIAGFVWASPMTLLGVIYASALTLLGWSSMAGVYGDAVVWTATPAMPKYIKKSYFHGGQTVGNVIVLLEKIESPRGVISLIHQQDHVRQFMTLGVFQPVFYTLMSLGIRLACPRSNSHYSNPFELEARRSAGQLIDVEGTVERLQSYAKKKREQEKKAT